MINQLNNTDNTVFKPLKSSSGLYAISTPFTPEQKQEAEHLKEKKSHRLGYSIAKVAIGVGLGVLLMAIVPQGLRKRALKGLQTSADKLVGSNPNLHHIQNKTLQGLDKTREIILDSKSFFNFSNLKDVLFRKLTKNIPVVKDVCEKITKFFEKVSLGTCNRSYKKTISRFDDVFIKANQINAGLKNQPELNDVNKSIEKIQKHLDLNFKPASKNAPSPITKRLEKVNNDLFTLDEEYWKSTYGHKTAIKNKDLYTKFVAEDLAAPAKEKATSKVLQLKKAISNNLSDKSKAIKSVLNEIDTSVSYTDKQTRTIINNLRENLIEYSKNGNEETKKLILENLEAIKPQLKSEKIANKITETINFVSNDNVGEMQKFVAKYKELLDKGIISEKQYKEIEKSANKALTSLDNSIDVETDKLFDKVRDLRIGSAPMDALSVLGSVGVVGYGLSKAENKDEKISVALKYGIPAIGAVSVSLFCTMALVSGGPALIIGLVSGKAINILGDFLDKKRKQYKENPPTLASTAQSVKNAIIPE